MKLLIAGDFFLSESESVYIDEGLKDVLARCDYRVINYEGPVADKNYNGLPPKSGPRLMQPATTKKLLKELGVNALTLANNHIMDQGIEGYCKSINILKDFDLIGAGSWNNVYKLRIVEKKGVKVGLLNFSELQYGMLHDEWSQDKDAIGCAWVNHNRVNRLIMESKNQVDCLVAIVHAGLEMVEFPLPEWRDRYRELIDIGCDAVIAHHPHLVQGYEIYKDRPIAYSLGNFCFSQLEDMAHPGWNIGAMAILDITKDNISLSLIGTQFKEGVLCIMDTIAWHSMQEQLNSYLEPDVYMKKVNETCTRLMDSYRVLFAMGGLFPLDRHWLKNIARIILKRYDFVHTLNNLQCESHRWCISRAIRLTRLSEKK